MAAAWNGGLDIATYLLELGANRDKARNDDYSGYGGYTSLHLAADGGHLEIAKLLMVYGADLNARATNGQLPIDVAIAEDYEEIEQAIRDEPRRRMDEAPGKRAIEQDRHSDAATATATEEGEEGDEQSKKRQRLEVGSEAEEGKVAEEDEDSEPSDGEDD